MKMIYTTVKISEGNQSLEVKIKFLTEVFSEDHLFSVF